MNVGPLDRRISIFRKVITQDATYGTDIVSRVLLATVWANVQDILPSRAETTVQGGLELARNPTRIRIRWRADIDSSMEVDIWRPVPVTHKIIGGPSEIGQKEYLEIMCEKLSS